MNVSFSQFPWAAVKRIDDFRFENRITSKSDDIRRLIESGLEAKSKKTPTVSGESGPQEI